MINFFKRIWRWLFKKRKPDNTIIEASTEKSPVSPSELTCLEGKDSNDSVIVAIRGDLDSKASVLELMKAYMEELEGELDNNAPPYAKLAKLFECGQTPDQVEGHHYGVALGIRTGDQNDIWADYGNILGKVWSKSLGNVPPWVGKTFFPANLEKLKELTEGFESGSTPTYLGINHFNEIEDSPLNVLSILFLTFWMDLKDAPEEEQARYGYDKTGAQFISRRAHSVYHASDRDVFQLNYRWPELDNRPPLKYLIDELVEIADGLYLGQLLFATRRLMSKYDPKVQDTEYGYEHFGYFLLMDEKWKTEARRVFPYVGIPRSERVRQTPYPEKFTALTLTDPPDGACDDRILAEIYDDMRSQETVIDLMKHYSDKLMYNPDADSPYITKLHEIFNRGKSFREIRGFYRGALVTFRSQGLLEIFDLNTLNMVWGLARLFTPWTGKIFEDITSERLREITDNYETGEVPTFWGANTDSFRTTRKRITAKAMEIAGIWMEEASSYEKRTYGFDMKSFFFIGREGKSVNKENRGKQVFMINYRWPKLRTFPPDCYCIDEVVQIAEGLYLGQLNYATEIFKEYDPNIDPYEYEHRCFGYFLLMDQDWHYRRVKIGFDMDNI